MSTLKQMRAAYDDLSAGYKKLLSASELYDRDTAAPPVHTVCKQPPVVKVDASPPPKPSPPRKFAPKTGLISEEDDFSGEHIVPQRPTTERGSSRGSNRTANLTFITTDKDSV